MLLNWGEIKTMAKLNQINVEEEVVKVKIKPHRKIVYEYYEYLKKNCYGEENHIKSKTLASIFKIDVATQKYILKEINESMDFDKLISTYGSIYMCRTEQECKKAISNEIKVGLTRLNKGKAMADKLSRNGQCKLKLGKYYKDFITVFEE